MYLVIIILNKEEHLDDILQSFLEVGITDATVVDSKTALLMATRNGAEIVGLGDTTLPHTTESELIIPLDPGAYLYFP